MTSRWIVLATAAALAVLAGCSSDGGSTDAASPSAPASTSASAASSAPSDSGSGAPTASAEASSLSDLPPAEILKKSFEAAKAASSVGVQASVTTPQGSTAYELALNDEGLVGQVLLPSVGPLEILVVDGFLYMRGTDALYAQFLSGEEATAAAGKWLKLPKEEALSIGLLPATDKQGLLDSAIAPTESRKLTTTDKTEQVGGVRAIGLDSGKGILWIAAEGEPYPLSLEAVDKKSGTFEFVDWNTARVELAAPDDADVVDLSAQAQPGP